MFFYTGALIRYLRKINYKKLRMHWENLEPVLRASLAPYNFFVRLNNYSGWLHHSLEIHNNWPWNIWEKIDHWEKNRKLRTRKNDIFNMLHHYLRPQVVVHNLVIFDCNLMQFTSTWDPFNQLFLLRIFHTTSKVNQFPWFQMTTTKQKLRYDHSCFDQNISWVIDS